MNCKHPYYRLENGQLLCSQCGKPPPSKKVIEDKIGKPVEDKIDHNVETKTRQDKIREQTRERVKRYREKEKALQ